MTAKSRSKSIGSLGLRRSAATALAFVAAGLTGHGQTPAQDPSASTPTAAITRPAPAAGVVGVTPPPGYLIGPEDVLSVVYWREKEMTTDAAVRPDGKISLPLLNDIQAAGLTPGQLRDRITEESARYIEDPNVTVVVKQINSRKVFITGEVEKPGSYALAAPTTVLQLLSTAGGLKDYAKTTKIVIIRNENGRVTAYPFNYKDVTARKNLRQNIELKPGDTVIVPE